jgi:septum formation protein
MKLVLASASARRAQILRDAGMRFEIVRANVSERRKRDETARLITRRLAQAKAQAVVRKILRKPGKKLTPVIVIGADTIVEVKGQLLGKPRSPTEAREMLRRLSGRTHCVVTSVTAVRLPDGAAVTATESTRVRFAALSAGEIARYVATGEPLDKAGAYAVQGIGGRYIERIDGCYFNVVGLPLARLYRLLIGLGWHGAVPRRTITSG